eukprot:1876025-Rhodomonas_salina.1
MLSDHGWDSGCPRVPWTQHVWLLVHGLLSDGVGVDERVRRQLVVIARELQCRPTPWSVRRPERKVGLVEGRLLH